MSTKMRKPEVLKLAENLDITEATPLIGELLKHRGADIKIDASSVKKMGGQCLQALLCASATWTLDGTHIEIITPSDDFLQCVEAYGLHLSHFSSQEPAL